MRTIIDTYLAFSCISCDLKSIEKQLPELLGDCYVFTKNMPLQDLNHTEQLRGGAHFDRMVFYQPKEKDCCIMVSNYVDGMSSFTYRLSALIGIKIYNFQLSSDSVTDPMSSFSLVESGVLKRMVYAMKDGKWTFYSVGTPLPFEYTSFYKNKIIKQRLNLSIITKYCAALGLDIQWEQFWNTNHALIVERIKW